MSLSAPHSTWVLVTLSPPPVVLDWLGRVPEGHLFASHKCNLRSHSWKQLFWYSKNVLGNHRPRKPHTRVARGQAGRTPLWGGEKG